MRILHFNGDIGDLYKNKKATPNKVYLFISAKRRYARYTNRSLQAMKNGKIKTKLKLVRQKEN